MPAAAAVASRPSRSPTAATARAAGRHLERHQPAGESLRVQVAEEEIGVGDRRLLAAAPVAGRPRIGARAARAHAQAARAVDPRDAPAPGPDGIHVHHRRPHRIRADESLGGDQRLAAPHHRHVIARAAHVERDEIPYARALGGELGADDARRGTREEERHRLLCGDTGRDDPSARAHHERHTGDAQAPEGLGEAGQVALHDRAEIGVERGDAKALVLAEGRVHVGRQRHADLGRHLAADLPRPALVPRIDEREEIADRDGLHAVSLQRRHRGADLRLVERHEDGAARVQTLADADAPAPRRDERGGLRIHVEVVHAGALLTPHLEHVLESLGGQDRRHRALLLEHGIGGHGRCHG